MEWGTKVKRALKKILLPSRTYTDNKWSELKKMLDKQQKLLTDIQKNEQKQMKAIENVKLYVGQELKRRDEWGKCAAETRRLAQGQKVWVIKCPAPEGNAKDKWGDYAYAMSLKRYLERMNIYVIVDTREDWDCEAGADVVLVLRGKFFYRPDRRNEKCIYIMWNISHPDLVTKAEYELYDVVCVASMYYAEKLKKELDVPVYPLLQCTDTELFYPEEPEKEKRGEEYVFIGNTRGVARNCVIWAAEEKTPLRIWGSGWNKVLENSAELVEAPSIENSQVPGLYRSAKATLNDHWKDMLDNQFINNRIFDALACGLPVISDGCEELREIFPDAVLYYESKEEFEACLRRLEDDYDAVKEKVAEQWDLIREKYSFEVRTNELVEIARRCKKQNGFTAQ